MKIWKGLAVSLIAVMLVAGCDFENLFGSKDDNKTVLDEFASLGFAASADSVITLMANYPGTLDPNTALDLIKAAETLYKKALEADPDNSHAAFGASLTGFQRIMDDQDLKMVRNNLTQWDNNKNTTDAVRYHVSQYFLHGLDRVTITETWGTPPYQHTYEWDYFIYTGEAFGALMYLLRNSFSDPNPMVMVQNILTRSVIPAIDNSINLMNRVLDDPEFQFIVTSGMTGMDENIRLDHGEASLIKAMMHLVRGNMKLLTAYNVAIPGVTSPLDINSGGKMLPLVKAADTPGSSFLKLKNNTILPSAKTDLITFLDLIDSSVNSIQSRTGDQSTALIKKDYIDDAHSELGEMTPEDWNKVPIPVLRNASSIADITTGLRTILDGPIDIETPDGDIRIDMSAFLNNAIPDVKAVLPYREWGDFNTMSREYHSPIVHVYRMMDWEVVGIWHLLEYYNQAINSEDWIEVPELVGGFENDGYLKITHTLNWVWPNPNPTLEPIPANFPLTADGGIYVDSNGRVSMTSSAYTTLNNYFKNAPHSTLHGMDLLWWASRGCDNFDLNHPIGIRASNGQMRFPYSFEFDDDDIIWFTDGTPQKNKVDEPVFPDPTFGGVLPDGLPQSASKTAL